MTLKDEENEVYRIYPKYLDRQASTIFIQNIRTDKPEQIVLIPMGASDHGLHCLSIIQQCLDKSVYARQTEFVRTFGDV